MKRTIIFSLLAAALTLVSCSKSELKPLTGVFPDATVVQLTTVSALSAEQDAEGRRVFTLDLTDGTTPLHLTLIGSKFFLTPNQYVEALDAVAKNGNFVQGKSSIAGKNIKQGYVNVDLLAESETGDGVENTYSINTVVFLEDGTPYKTFWTGKLAFEKDAVLAPQFYYTDTVAQDCTDADGNEYKDVESHTLVLNDPSGNFAAQIKLIRPVGTKNLVGEYTVKEYAHEDFTAGNGFDLGVYFGMAAGAYVIGSYYTQDGNVVIIEPGAKISVSAVADGGFYSIDGDGFSFLCAPEGYVPGVTVYDGADTVAQDCTDADGNEYKDVESHTIVLKNDDGAVAAQIKLVRAVGTTDLSGTYTVKEYAHEDFSAGNGFDLGVYFGMDAGAYVIGTYFFDEEGALVIVEPGETITVTKSGDNYTFSGSTDWEFTAKVTTVGGNENPGGGDENPEEPGEADQATLTDFLSYTSYAQYGISLAGAELATAGFSYTADFDFSTFQTTYTFSGDGSFIKLELYTEGDSFAPGTYVPSVDASNVAAGEFKTGSASGGTTWNVVKDNQITSKPVTDGTVTVSKEGDVYTIVIATSVVNATYTGKLSAE